MMAVVPAITSPLAAVAVMVAIAMVAGCPLPALPFAVLSSGAIMIMVVKIAAVTVADSVTVILAMTFMLFARHRVG